MNPTDPNAWGDFILKVGLGIASFMALCYGAFWVLRWFTRELKESRASFLVAINEGRVELKEDRAAHVAEMDKLIRVFEKGHEKIIDRLDSLECAPPRDRSSRG